MRALLLLLLALPALAQSPPPTRHAGQGASSYEVRRGADGAIAMTSRNLRYEPFAAFDGERHRPRLVTVTTQETQRTDREGVEGRVSVTVDDLSGAQPRRMASFNDPGTEGVRRGERHFVTTSRGCCAGPSVHRVRLLESGRLIARATGPGPVGTSAWLEAPNARPRLTRWAAYDGDPQGQAPGVIGIIAWGGEGGAAQRVALHHAGEPADSMDMILMHGGRMVVVVPQTAGAAGGPEVPEGGLPEQPVAVWGLDGGRPAAEIGGFSVRLTDAEGRVVAEIPVAADRLAVDRAVLGAGFSLVLAR